MKNLSAIIIALVVFGSTASAHNTTANPTFYNVSRSREAAVSQVLGDLRKSRLVLIGEHHTDTSHHAVQLQIIRMLHAAGLDVVIGMEMFSSESQDALNSWVDSRIGQTAFEKIYYDNWTYPWRLYEDILEYARDEKLPLVGLNVPRGITRQVAHQGFQSLSEDQKEKISHVTCRVDKAYMDYIRKAFGGHGHGDLNFVYFCEAQLVWDTVMAVNALKYLSANPQSVMVILAGTGHVRKQAIPAQIRDRSDIALRVILPEVPGSIERSTVDSDDADYLVLELH